MSNDDILGDVVERLEWDERKQEDTPGKRFAAVDAADRAHGRGRGNRGGGARGLRLEQEH